MFSTADSASTAASARCCGSRAAAHAPRRSARPAARGLGGCGGAGGWRSRASSGGGVARRARAAVGLLAGSSERVMSRAPPAAARGRPRRSRPRPTLAARARRECCAATTPRSRQSLALAPRGRGWGRTRACVVAARRRLAAALGQQLRQPRGQRARALVHGAASRRTPARSTAASAQATASALSDSVSKRRASSCSRASSPAFGSARLRVAAPRDLEALAQRRAHVQHPGAVGAAQPLLPGARVGVAAQRAHVHGDRARRPGRRRAAPAPPRSASSAGASAPLIQPTCEQATRRVRGPTALGDLAPAAPRARSRRAARARRQRAQQPGVLLVAGQDLIARAELQAADHLRDALARAARQRDVARRRSRAPRRRRSRSCAARARARRSKCACARPSLGLALELLRARRATAARAAARRCPRSDRRAGSRTGNSARRPERSTNGENSPRWPAHADQQTPLWEPSPERVASAPR